MKDPEAKRYWRFYAEDWGDSAHYLDAEGKETDRDEATKAPFIGTATEASDEADRRGDLWEDNPACEGITQITSESFGRVPAESGS